MARDIEELIDREGLTLAPLRSRSFAYVIDDLIISLLITAIFYDKFVNSHDLVSTIEIINSAFTYIVLLKIIYHTFFSWKYGQSIGKMVARIKIIEISSLDNPSFLVSLNRAIFRAIGELFFFLGFAIAFFDQFRQSLHDKSSKTLVIDAN